MNKVKIRVVGCDASTDFEMDISPEELEFLERLEQKCNSTSSCICEPRIRVMEEKK